MSSQAIDNQIQNSIRRVITEVRKKATQEGKKQISKLKDQLPTPNSIINRLTPEINQNTCSGEGRNKMEDTSKELKDKLNKMDEVAQMSSNTLQKLIDKIGLISSKVDIPTPGPLESIKEITGLLKPIINTLKYVIRAAPAILASNVSVGGVGAISGTAIINTSDGVKLAKGKIQEYTNLFNTLPDLLDNYIAMADKVFDQIHNLKTQLDKIINEIARLKLFIIYLELDFENKCNNLQTIDNPPIIEPPIQVTSTPPLTLQDVIKQAEELYGKVLENLIARGDTKGIRRVYVLGAQFQRIKNIKVEVIDI